jgi:hypothetical protein
LEEEAESPDPAHHDDEPERADGVEELNERGGQLLD